MIYLKNSKICSIQAREILDSRGNPTVEVDVCLADGSFGRAAVPSGASTGEYEAIELRDENKKRFMGKGVLKAVENVNKKISKLLLSQESLDQRKIDSIMIEADNTENKKSFGANAILGVSMAVAKASACFCKLPLYKYLGGNLANELPVPMMNILNGGSHADNNIDFQEFMILPVGANSFKHALQMGCEIFHTLKSVLKKKNYSTSVGDEGGFAPDLKNNDEAFELVLQAIEQSGYKPEKDVLLGLDAAASEFFDKNKKNYFLKSENQEKTTDQMIEWYENLVSRYPILTIEDGLDENDWEGWKKLSSSLNKKVQLVGDDLFVTNTKKLKQGIHQNIANSILVKVNQIGSLTETVEAIQMAKTAKYTSVVSHRSGETEDVTISHIAVGLGSGQIKTGSLARTDRVSKYNELLRIEEELGKNAIYKGRDTFYNLEK